MIAKELRTRNNQELNTLLTEARSKLFDAKIKNATHQLLDNSQIQKARREIARINTILRSRMNIDGSVKGQE